MIQSPNKWLAPPRTIEAPVIKLFTLPYAGAGASAYYSWTAPLADAGIQLIPIQLPGRENRLGESPYVDCQTLVSDIADALMDELSTPYAIFGHSMGATVGYELSCELLKRGLPAPKHLFVSGRNAPHVPWLLEKLHTLSNDAFIRRVSELFGNISEAILSETELLKIIIPILRADFQLLHEYCHQPKPKLNCPLTAFNGSNDSWTDLESIQSWERYTSAPFTYNEFKGSHFFINELTSDVISAIKTALLNQASVEKHTVTFEL